MTRAGGEDGVLGRHPGEHADGGPARAQNGLSGIGREVAADLGLVLCVLSDHVDHGVGLSRARRRIEVHDRRDGSGIAPTDRQLVVWNHLTAKANPKSSAGSVHQWVRTRPAAASSPATPSWVNLHDTSVNISSPSANSTVMSRSATRTR